MKITCSNGCKIDTQYLEWAIERRVNYQEGDPCPMLKIEGGKMIICGAPIHIVEYDWNTQPSLPLYWTTNEGGDG